MNKVVFNFYELSIDNPFICFMVLFSIDFSIQPEQTFLFVLH